MRAFLKSFLLTSLVSISVLLPSAWAAMSDNPLVYALKAEQLEWRDADGGNIVAWDAEAWAGYDRDKLWLKSEGETTSDATEDFELQLLYGRSVTPYWDLQLGWLGDFQPERRRNWLAVGLQGLAPGFIETEATAFFSSSGRAAGRLKASHESYLTQRWVLVPRLELNWYADDDEVNEIGSGFSNMELALRLKYQITPNIAPYAGLLWEKRFGDTADLVDAEGERTSEIQFLVGLSFWF